MGLSLKTYFAHSHKDNRCDWQTLPDHLEAVSNLAARYAAPFGLGRLGAIAGLYHDLGKYDPAFDRRLMGVKLLVDHSTAGAAILLGRSPPNERLAMEVIAYAILGHHAGLPDGNTADRASLRRRTEGFIDKLDPEWRQQVAPPEAGLGTELLALMGPRCSAATAEFDLSVVTRMLFSCLVDADFRDTEAFYAAAENATKDRDWPPLASILPELTAAFDAHMAGITGGADSTGINTLRAEVLSHVRSKATMTPGLFTLTVPTGGGKTLASLGFALSHACVHGHQRIIYAIPFTSIIDQTAAIFRTILGADNVLEHHSAIEDAKENDNDRNSRDKLRLAMEDWAAPVVVTTNVQLFESLFAGRPGRARKLHNIAGSIIVLDEAQTIPRPLLIPCLQMLDTLTRLFGCSIVLCTATQPAVDEGVLKGGLALAGRELAPDPANLATRLRRTKIAHGGAMDNGALIAALQSVDQGLIVVNSRVHALDLWQEARGLEGLFHLSTRQYAAHRRRLLATIRQRLAAGLPCRVISTSLIEAGVDISFPRAWRAEAGLDQIVQVAGRVNRHGEMLPALGQVTVFAPEGYAPPPEIKGLIGDMGRIQASFEDLQSPEAIRRYFSEVYWRLDANLDREKILESFKVPGGKTDFAFRSVAERFRMIESGMVPVIVPRDDAALKAIDDLAKPWVTSGVIARALQSHLVTVPPKARERMRICGKGEFTQSNLRADQFFVLTDPDLYHDETGLHWEDADYLSTEAGII